MKSRTLNILFVQWSMSRIHTCLIQAENQNGASSEDIHLPPSSRGVEEYDSDYLFHIPPLLYRKCLGEGTSSNPPIESV